MPTSEQDIENLHSSNEDLRNKIAEARAARAQVQNQASLDTQAAGLKTENARLEAQLEAELNAASTESEVADKASAQADAPAESAYEKMMREAEEANAAAQAEADKASGKKAKPNGNGTNTPPAAPSTGDNGNGGQ